MLISKTIKRNSEGREMGLLGKNQQFGSELLQKYTFSDFSDSYRETRLVLNQNRESFSEFLEVLIQLFSQLKNIQGGNNISITQNHQKQEIINQIKNHVTIFNHQEFSNHLRTLIQNFTLEGGRVTEEETDRILQQLEVELKKNDKALTAGKMLVIDQRIEKRRGFLAEGEKQKNAPSSFQVLERVSSEYFSRMENGRKMRDLRKKKEVLAPEREKKPESPLSLTLDGALAFRNISHFQWNISGQFSSFYDAPVTQWERTEKMESETWKGISGGHEFYEAEQPVHKRISPKDFWQMQQEKVLWLNGKTKSFRFEEGTNVIRPSRQEETGPAFYKGTREDSFDTEIHFTSNEKKEEHRFLEDTKVISNEEKTDEIVRKSLLNTGNQSSILWLETLWKGQKEMRSLIQNKNENKLFYQKEQGFSYRRKESPFFRQNTLREKEFWKKAFDRFEKKEGSSQIKTFLSRFFGTPKGVVNEEEILYKQNNKKEDLLLKQVSLSGESVLESRILYHKMADIFASNEVRRILLQGAPGSRQVTEFLSLNQPLIQSKKTILDWINGEASISWENGQVRSFLSERGVGITGNNRFSEGGSRKAATDNPPLLFNINPKESPDFDEKINFGRRKRNSKKSLSFGEDPVIGLFSEGEAASPLLYKTGLLDRRAMGAKIFGPELLYHTLLKKHFPDSEGEPLLLKESMKIPFPGESERRTLFEEWIPAEREQNFTERIFADISSFSSWRISETSLTGKKNASFYELERTSAFPKSFVSKSMLQVKRKFPQSTAETVILDESKSTEAGELLQEKRKDGIPSVSEREAQDYESLTLSAAAVIEKRRRKSKIGADLNPADENGSSFVHLSEKTVDFSEEEMLPDGLKHLISRMEEQISEKVSGNSELQQEAFSKKIEQIIQSKVERILEVRFAEEEKQETTAKALERESLLEEEERLYERVYDRIERTIKNEQRRMGR